MRLTSVTVVLPGLGAQLLRAAVRDATKAATDCAARHEIVIVDDGRADDTIALAGALAARDPCVRLIVHASDRDAERAGIAAAHMEWIVVAHSGFEFDELADFAVRADQLARVRGPRAALRRLRDTVARA